VTAIVTGLESWSKNYSENLSFMNWSEFFNMGGYAFFVWTSYALALIIVVGNIVSPIMQRKKAIKRIKRAMKRENIELANNSQGEK
jgi:heme exporter protein D